MGMTESQRLVVEWKGQLKQMGWPDDAIKRIVSDLCEAGYRQCVDDIQTRAQRDSQLVERAVRN